MEKRAAELLARWQGVMRLSDWDIRIEVVRQEWRKSGDVKIDLDNRMAAVMLHESIPVEHLEEVMVHELLHIKLYSMDQMIEEALNIIYGETEPEKKELAYSRFMLDLETTTEDLTKSLLTAKDGRREFWFKRVERQIARELSR